MLYDVLPPLVFFVSLGGIILVVSRVVLRIRRTQLTHSVRAVAHGSQSDFTAHAEDLAHIIGPSKKSVRIIRNRLILVSHFFQNLFSRLETSVQQHRHTLFKRASDSPRFALRAHVSQWRASTRHAYTVVRDSTQRWRLPRPAASLTTPPLPRPTPKLTIVELPTVQPIPSSPVTSSQPQHRGMRGKFMQRQKTPALERARESLAAAQFRRAEKILVPYLVKNPKHASAYMMLAEAAVASGDWSEALEIYEQVASLKPNLDGVYAALGKAAFQAGKFTRAIEALQLAHNANPQDSSVIKLLLKIASRMDNAPLQRSLRGELASLKKAQKQLP